MLTPLLGVFAGFAQQQEHFSMYMQDNFLLNPAEGGTEEFTDTKIGYRTQWIQFGSNSGPRTLFLSGHTPIGKSETELEGVEQVAFHGTGGVIISDNIGPFNVLTAKAAYSYHLPVFRDLIISLGVFGGMKQYAVKEDYLFPSSDPSQVDPLLNFKTTVVPDMTLGLWGYSKSYYFGFASFQLLNSQLNVYSDVSAGLATLTGTLNTHHWATAGYKVDIDTNWFVVPSFVLKFVKGAPLTFDLNAKLRYQDKYWTGISYRKEDAVVMLLGLTVKRKIDIGYAFDITRTDIKNFSSGTHEFVIGYRVPNHQYHPPPAQFW